MSPRAANNSDADRSSASAPRVERHTIKASSAGPGAKAASSPDSAAPEIVIGLRTPLWLTVATLTTRRFPLLPVHAHITLSLANLISATAPSPGGWAPGSAKRSSRRARPKRTPIAETDPYTLVLPAHVALHTTLARSSSLFKTAILALPGAGPTRSIGPTTPCAFASSAKIELPCCHATTASLLKSSPTAIAPALPTPVAINLGPPKRRS
jgi:hypothetical protein